MPELQRITEIDNPFNNAPVFYIEETDSTMKLAEEYFSSVASPGGTVFMTGMQTSGRGRVPGRIWESVINKNLLFTLVLSKTEMGSNPLPLVIGLGILKYLEKNHQMKPEIKWPNDIYIKGKKISGVIIECRKGLFNIGIGLNINQTEFPKSILNFATSLSAEKRRDFILINELELILNELKEILVLDSWQREITDKLYNIGKEVTVSTGLPGIEEKVTGVIEGIGPRGQLLLRKEGSLKEIYSGEVSL